MYKIVMLALTGSVTTLGCSSSSTTIASGSDEAGKAAAGAAARGGSTAGGSGGRNAFDGGGIVGTVVLSSGGIFASQGGAVSAGASALVAGGGVAQTSAGGALAVSGASTGGGASLAGASTGGASAGGAGLGAGGKGGAASDAGAGGKSTGGTGNASGASTGGTSTSGAAGTGGTSANPCSATPNPCLNGGTCTNGINGYTCDCTGTGFTGTTCQTNIDDCSSNPCPTGTTCVDGINTYTCNSWCERQSIPSGIEVSDYACADLDEAMPAGWSSSNGAASIRSNERALSPAYSWKSVVSTGTQSGTLTWIGTGSAGAVTATVRAGINNNELAGPVAGYYVDLLCIEYANATACLQSDGLANLEIAWTYLGSAAAADICAVNGDLVAGTWQDVELSLAQTNGVITARINGTLVTSSCQMLRQLAGGTVVEVRVGAALPSASISYTAYFDNIQAWVDR